MRTIEESSCRLKNLSDRSGATTSAHKVFTWSVWLGAALCPPPLGSKNGTGQEWTLCGSASCSYYWGSNQRLDHYCHSGLASKSATPTSGSSAHLNSWQWERKSELIATPENPSPLTAQHKPHDRITMHDWGLTYLPRKPLHLSQTFHEYQPSLPIKSTCLHFCY